MQYRLFCTTCFSSCNFSVDSREDFHCEALAFLEQIPKTIRSQIFFISSDYSTHSDNKSQNFLKQQKIRPLSRHPSNTIHSDCEKYLQL